jgi:hypothetical protein
MRQNIMLGGIKTDERTTAMQDRVQRHYGGIVRAGSSPSLATTDLASSASQSADATPTWEQALSRAMDRSTSLMAAQADLSAREAEVARREAQLEQREKAAQSDRKRVQLESMFGPSR